MTEGLEERLLLCCARRVPVGGLVGQELDWQRVLRMAAVHGVSALLYPHLKGLDEVPAEVLAELRKRAYQCAIRSLRLTSELIRVMDALRTSGVDAVPFKGPVLAVRLYGEAALREFSDLDILVRWRDFGHAQDVLERLGYKDPEASSRVLRLEAGNIVQVLVRQETGTTVDLHWGLIKRRLVQNDPWADVWGRLVTVDLGGRDMPTLAAEDLLLFLCVHGAKHRWTSLAWICDVAELFRARPEIQWGLLVERARVSGTWRMLMLGLMLAHDLLGAVVPDELLKSGRADSVVCRLAEEIREGMFDGAWGRAGPWRRLVFLLRVTERFGCRLRHVAMILVSPVYFLRPVRVVVEYAGGAVRRR